MNKALWEALLSKYSSYDGHHIKIGNLEIWGDFINLTERIDDVIKNSEEIEAYPFVNLEDTLSWKTFLNREKDQKDIEQDRERENNKSGKGSKSKESKSLNNSSIDIASRC